MMGDCSIIFSHINIQLGNTYIIKKGIKLVTLQVSTNKKKAKHWFSLQSYKTDLVFHFMELNEIKVPNQYLVHYEHKWTKCIDF